MRYRKKIGIVLGRWVRVTRKRKQQKLISFSFENVNLQFLMFIICEWRVELTSDGGT